MKYDKWMYMDKNNNKIFCFYVYGKYLKKQWFKIVEILLQLWNDYELNQIILFVLVTKHLEFPANT